MPSFADRLGAEAIRSLAAYVAEAGHLAAIAPTTTGEATALHIADGLRSERLAPGEPRAQ